jgi:hypothetical protein
MIQYQESLILCSFCGKSWIEIWGVGFFLSWYEKCNCNTRQQALIHRKVIKITEGTLVIFDEVAI